MHSIILTVHNKDWLIEKVLEGIILNTRTPYELIIIIWLANIDSITLKVSEEASNIKV